ncbi:MAG: hypothetical protein J6S86_04020 [Alphaproteobacteria bacterium]|nr:hypothetical protein [Alphaproteobacteria bacterium]
MRIGLLSICAMMFLLYGTDCRADRNVKDFEVSGASQVVDGEGFTPVSDMNRKTRKRARFINKKQSDAAENNKNPWFRDKRSFADVVKGVKKGEDDNKTVVVKGVKREEDDNKTVVGDYDYQQGIDGFANVAEGVKKEEDDNKTVVGDYDYQQGIEESNPQPSAKNNENPWFRDKRSFADVVKGVKKEDENVREKSAESEEQFFDAVGPAEIDLQENKNAESEEQFFDAVGPEYNALSEEKTSDKFDSTSDEGKSQQNIDGFANVAEGVKKDNKSHQVKKAHHAEMTKEQRAARSKKAFEARRSREKQRRKFTDEVRKN